MPYDCPAPSAYVYEATAPRTHGAYYRVQAYEADLRKVPKANPIYELKDLNQLTQLVRGERVRILDQYEGWVLVEALDQPWYSPEGEWSGYMGWLQSESLQAHPDRNAGHSLVLGTSRPLTTQSILQFARPYLGTPYFWGGASPVRRHEGAERTGVDCSGLTMLLYRAHGTQIPRDAHDQFLASTPLKAQDLRPGDFIFAATPKERKRIDHVLVYIEGETLLEATKTVGLIRLVSFQDKYGKSLAQMRAGVFPEETRIEFGRPKHL